MEYNPDCPKLPWMVEFYSTDSGTILNGQLKAAFAETTLEYLSALNIKSKTSPYRATQVVCTVPRHVSCNTLEELMARGMSVARLLTVNNNKQQLSDMISKIKAVVESYSRKIGRIYPLAIALEIKGPEIRIGNLKNDTSSIYLAQGKPVTITTDQEYADYVNEDTIFVDYEKLPEVVQPGDRMILAHGAVRLSAIEAAESIIRCIVERAGKLISRDSLTVPNVPLDLPVICEEDKEIVQLAIDKMVDFIFVAGVYNQESLYEMKSILGEEGDEKLRVIAKLENLQALENIDGIIRDCDGICIDCEKLGLEIPKEKLFLVQKSVVAKCNLEGKPVICSITIADTNQLEKSEVCDIANAILDGTDALIISQKACAKDVMQNLSMVCKEAEPAIYQKQVFRDLVNNLPSPNESIYSLCISAVEASLKSSSAAIICLTTSGRTARVLSMFRPRCPIIAVTRYKNVARWLRVYRGVEPLVYLKPLQSEWRIDVEERVQIAIQFGKELGYIKMGDSVVTVTGSVSQCAIPDCMRLLYASDFDTILAKTKYQPL